MNTIEWDAKYIADTYARFPLEIIVGKGSYVYDGNGKQYIDMATGIAVNTFGYCDTPWIEAVSNQLNLYQHCSNLYYSAPSVKLAKMLTEKTGLKKVFFGNSGAEANECAIKLARKYAQDKYGQDRYKILTLKNSFHGRTITTLAATGQDVFHEKFLPLTDGFVYAEANNIEDLQLKAQDGALAGIMIEVVQGEGGVTPLSRDFVARVADICKERDLVFIADEVQTGNGRTGKLYGYMHYDVTPDVVTTAKGLGGGLPIGACIMGTKVENVLARGDHGSTFGANPVVCAGALSILSRLDDACLKGVLDRSAMIFDTLGKAEGVKSISGMGLMIGIETVKDAQAVINDCIANGVLVIKAKNKVRLLPPLNIDKKDLKKALDVIVKALK